MKFGTLALIALSAMTIFVIIVMASTTSGTTLLESTSPAVEYVGYLDVPLDSVVPPGSFTISTLGDNLDYIDLTV